MKRLSTLIMLAVISLSAGAQVSLSYYLPKDVNYDQSIVKPEEFAGHQVGEWHLTHDKLYFYMLKLSDISGRAFWEEYGKSHEGRPLGNLVISSEENIKNIESIRKKHIALSDPAKSDGTDISDMPVVVKLGYGVHGNESSSQNAAMLMAYYLVAGNGDKINELLENTIVLLDPCLNPDGFNRHATWVNMYKSKNLNPDANSIEFREGWPGGRTNHYWYDLNRDYIMLQHPESIGRVAAFHRWKPNINTDHHEMGASSTFFFQPGVRTRENPLTPKENYELVTEIASYHIKYLDEIGSLYYSEEGFDDFYIGKGSAYPDIHASVGILFEQAGVKGHLREVPTGLLSFPFAIRNQVTVSLSTLEAGLQMREKLLQHQIDFYNDAMAEASTDEVKGYVFSDDGDKARAAHFMENLLRHQINIYRLSRNLTLNGKQFKADNSYVVPLDQPEYRYIKSMFETVKEFEEEIFYDISTWTLPMSFNLPYASYGSGNTAGIAGPRVVLPQFPEGSLQAQKDAYAYVFEWKDYYAPKALFMIQEAGLIAKMGKGTFTYDDGEFRKDFKEGTIMVQAYGQNFTRDELYDFMKDVVAKTGVAVYGLSTGHTVSGIDIGSNSFSVVDKPEVLMFIGSGSSSRDAGEIWHITDTRFNLPVTMVNGDRNVDLSRYNVVILTGSGLAQPVKESLAEWTRKGGTLIALKGANSFVRSSKLADIKYIPSAQVGEEGGRAEYASRRKDYSHQRIPGSIFEVNLDLTHPLCYGYARDILPVYKSGATAYEISNDQYNNPAVFSDKTLLSGFSSDENIERISGSAYISVHSAGRGKVISFYDNPNFRGIWYGTSKLFMNAIFFGKEI